ncbi:uncharacterized protein LOC113066103 isoform X3 [Carassius auratus]|uniref:Uncharacterized protein LOC113066103 isoform X3 n=1 Tax=Carassius auratus TaxID=7957 RepID=A0A6P6MAJ7_CARAU|nr:uncharacterized protein LOC113066103 isoform X3 [Carassius auratus]
MLSKSVEERPTIEEGLQAVKSFDHQSDQIGTTDSYSNKNRNKDRVHTENCIHQAKDEMDVPENLCSDVTNSYSHTKEELSECEMSNTEQQIYPFLETSEKEEKAKQAQWKVAEEKAIQGKLLTKARMELNEYAQGCASLQPNVIKVKVSSNTPRQRIYDKKNFCLYCEKPYAKITRHLIQKHSGEVEVAKALSCKQDSTKRNLFLTKIRNMGNYHHNSSVLSSGKGEIIPKRQATSVSTATDYLPCKFCFAMYIKTDLWKHHKRCKLQVKDKMPVKQKVQASCSLLLPMDSTISSGLQKVIEDMTFDDITQVVKSDPLILSLGERMFLKNGEVGRHRADIRNRMRELARLLLVARAIDKDVVALKDLINPVKFNTVLEAVKKMTGFDSSTNQFSVPSTALKLRRSFVKVSYILQGEALRQEDDALKGRAEHFSKLIELEWTIHVPFKNKLM